MRVHQYEDDHQVYRLDLGWPEPFVSNAYLVDDGEVTLIDSGYPYNQRSIQDELGKAGYAVEDIDQVLLTHYDLDHVGGLSRIADELDAPIYMGRDDLELMQGDEDPPLLHHKGMFHRIAREAYELPGSLEFRAVDDGDELGGFTALHTPGHNPGHTAYIHEDTGAGFVGDLVWADEGELTTPFVLDSYDTLEMRESVARLLEEYPDIDSVYMAHGNPVEEGASSSLQAILDRGRL